MADLESLADAPGTLREYETIYVLRPETPNDRVADINQRVRGIIEKMGGKVLDVDNWGKRRLAYEIDNHFKGIYLYWQYLGSPAAVAEFERNMRMFDSVIRYMTVKIDENVEPQARPSDLDEEAYERAATTAAEEEEAPGRGDDAEAATDAGDRQAADAEEAAEGGDGADAGDGADESEGEAQSDDEDKE